MKPVSCSHCGAPPATAVTPDAQGMYTCAFCGKLSYVTPPVEGAGPAIRHNWADHLDDDDHDHDDEDDDDEEDDEPPPRRAAETAAVTAHRISWIVWLVVVLGVTGGAGVGITRCTKGSSLLSSLVWDGKEPLQCGGNDRISVTGVTANFNAGAAIIASGNCQVRCEGCTITAATAVEAGGNAQVTIANGAVTGTALLADASGNARVTFMGDVKVSGTVKESRKGQVSTPTPPPAASAPEPAKAQPAASSPAKAAPSSAPAKARAKGK